MASTGSKVESGIRFEFSRRPGGSDGWRYGCVWRTRDAEGTLELRVDASGETSLVEAGCAGVVAERARQLLRATVRRALGRDRTPPRSITRWRPEP